MEVYHICSRNWLHYRNPKQDEANSFDIHQLGTPNTPIKKSPVQKKMIRLNKNNRMDKLS